MRKITYGGATSLDFFLARADHSMDWLMWCDEAAEVMNEYWKTIDTILMGRKTYDVSMKSGQGGGDDSAIKTFVFSRTLPEGRQAGATVVADAVPFVRELKRQPGKDICLMGGGELAHDLFEAGLIDEIGFNVHPVLLGSGIPAFLPMSRQINLELKECRPFKNGCVLISYTVKN